MTFIEEMEQSLIPAIERMLTANKEHLRGLQKNKEDIDNMPWYKRPFFSTEMIVDFIESNEANVLYLEDKLKGYNQYLKELKAK